MIRMGLLALVLSVMSVPAGIAQTADTPANAAPSEGIRVTTGLGARLKALDKINGQVAEFDVLSGGSVQIGKLIVEMRECRYPADNPAGEAFAYVVVIETTMPDPPLFSGWMIASSPALNALDHFRYDIWVLRCKTL